MLADYRFAANATHAAALGLKAGVDYDLQCGDNPDTWSYNKLQDALQEGLVDETDIDTAAGHVLTSKFAAGLFETPLVPTSGVVALINSPEKQQLALEAAQQGVVLVMNNHTLPLNLGGSETEDGVKKIALLGPIAACGNTPGQPGSCPTAVNAMTGSYTLGGVLPTLLDEALRSAAGDALNVTWAPGAAVRGPPGAGAEMLPEAVALAKDADVAIVVVGDGDGSCGEWADRDSLDPDGGQLQLLEAVLDTGTTTVVVHIGGRPMTFGYANAPLDRMGTFITAFRPGQAGGTAIVDVITGKVNPSGKLVQPWPRSVGQVRSGASPWLAEVRGKWIANNRQPADADGRHYDGYQDAGALSGSPLFYFGHGLSYTTYEYESLAVSVSPLEGGVASGTVVATATVSLKNTGAVGGTEVVQVYLQDPAGALPFVASWKRLVGFGRVRLDPGQSTQLHVPLLVDDVALHDEHFKPRIVAGAYLLSAGPASNADSLTANVTLPALSLA